MKDVFAVVSPGPYTTVQDRGRFHYQHMGVPVSGSLDRFASDVSNLLVGNSPGAAVLEMTFAGPTLEVLDEADIALAGAEMRLMVNGLPVPHWKTIRVRPGDVLMAGPARSGCRGYLAVSGGLDVPLVMGSRSTYVRGRLGGVEGRPLREGDVIRRGAGRLLQKARTLADPPVYPAEIELRAVAGPQDDCFRGGLDLFFKSQFQVSPQADRMGYRLRGPSIPRAAGAPLSIISEPSLPGNVQVPADGQPIVLLVEQTIGGYTKIATVISPDLCRLAQAKPGDTVTFTQTSIEEAHAACFESARRMAGIESLLGGFS